MRPLTVGCGPAAGVRPGGFAMGVLRAGRVAGLTQPRWDPGTLRGETGQHPEVTPVTCRRSPRESCAVAFEGLDGGEQAVRFQGRWSSDWAAAYTGVRAPGAQAAAPRGTGRPFPGSLQGLSRAGRAPGPHPGTGLLGQGAACGLAGLLGGSQRLGQGWLRAAVWARDATKPHCRDPWGRS